MDSVDLFVSDFLVFERNDHIFKELLVLAELVMKVIDDLFVHHLIHFDIFQLVQYFGHDSVDIFEIVI